jgi:hypothetical protein
MIDTKQTWWLHHTKGLCTVVPGDQELAGSIDDTWREGRRAGDGHGWTWRGHYSEGKSFFALTTDADEPEPLAAWQLRKLTLNDQLGSRVAVELARVEVHTKLRGDLRTWPLALRIISWQAVNAGAVIMVLGAIPQAEGVYVTSGATKGKIHGWKCCPTLLPFSYDEGTLRGYAQAAERVRQG